MLFSVKRGATGIVIRCKILDSSATTGAGKTGLTSASSGLRIGTIADNESTSTAYTVAGSTVESITTLGTYATPTATKARFKEVDSTNHPGLYELQIADARFAVSSAKSLTVSISGATNAAECDFVVPLQDLDPYDAVRAGLTALPNAAAAASGGLLVAGTGTNAINPSGGKVPATLASTDVTGNVAADIQTIKTQTVTCAAGVTVLASVGTAAPSTAQTGDAYARIGANGAGLTAVTGVTLAASQHVIVDSGTVTTLTNLPTAPTDWLTAASVKADAVTKVQAGLATPTNITAATGVTVATVNDKTGYSLTTTPPTSSTIAVAVWDLATSGHTTGGSFGAAMNAAGGAGDPWSTSLPGSYSSGTAGYILGTNLNGTISGIPTAVMVAVHADSDGTLQAATSTTATLASGAPSVDLSGQTLRLGDGQARQITAYNTSTKVATVDRAWGSTPTAGTTYYVEDYRPSSVTVGGYASGQDPATLTWAAGTKTITGGTITTYTGNTPQTGDAYARLGAPAGASLSADMATVASYVDTEVAAIKAKTDNLPASFPTNFASLAVTSGGLVSLNLSQTGLSPRTLDAVADASLTVGDALVCAVSAAAGKETVSGTSYVVKTPSTGTTIRTFTLDDATTPTSRT